MALLQRRAVCLLLLAALPWYCTSAMLTLLLGPQHMHKVVAAALNAPASLLTTVARHVHSHQGLLRHRHAHDDHTVVATESLAAADAGSPPSGEPATPAVGLLVLALAAALAWHMPAGLSHLRPSAAAAAFHSHIGRVPKKPPRP